MAYQYQTAMNGYYLRKGSWLQEEDEQLTRFVARLGERRWDDLAKVSGLRRSGKSCRLRWKNYLRPNLKHGPFSVEEQQLIVQLQQLWGNKWSRIACRLPGRTDNEIKNYWRTHKRKLAQIQQGDLKGKLEKSAQDLSQESTDNNMVSKEWESKDSSIDSYPLPEWEFRNSPYENRIFDWITELQSGYGEKELEQDSNSNGIHDYNPQGFEEGCECDAWDYSDSLWDMN
ncbi:hypothetical protein RIF29_20463 [Crotalaria pallida]|uniref:Uncharacterized protein n=1 Tax=Crotalaria pallida TaxID=3830 RepID=A0AAN9F309_CROPI